LVTFIIVKKREKKKKKKNWGKNPKLCFGKGTGGN